MGTWIEIKVLASNVMMPDCRSLRGNVDRNMFPRTDYNSAGVVPYVGTWIEIALQLVAERCSRVVPYVGTWIEILLLS